MIKLKKLLHLKDMVYSEDVKPKHKDKINMNVTVFRNDIQLPYNKGLSMKPDNDSKTTLDELKYLSNLKLDVNEVKAGDKVKKSFIPLIRKNNVSISEDYVKKILKESTKFIMEMKYHYNRPRPFQIAKIYDIDLNGTELDSMRTPSYPSGHAVQGYLVAKLLSKVDLKNSKEYIDMGEKIANSRIIGKAHFPSDKEFGRKVANVLFEGLVNNLEESSPTGNIKGMKGATGFIKPEEWESKKKSLKKSILKSTGYEMIKLKPLLERIDYQDTASQLVKQYNLKSKVKFGSGKDFGEYVPETDTITLRRSYPSVKEFLMTILHEIGHALDAHRIGIKKYIKKYTQAGTMAVYNGLDPHDDNKWEEKAERFAKREIKKWM
tara:strand:- start:6 stop:1139 length:1134 start_codon:yes stop_codon:yes gene_type:complete